MKRYRKQKVVVAQCSIRYDSNKNRNKLLAGADWEGRRCWGAFSEGCAPISSTIVTKTKTNCLQELIQNAEDAGARSVKIVTDTRCFHRELDDKTLKRHPHLRFLQVRLYTESASFCPHDRPTMGHCGRRILRFPLLRMHRYRKFSL